MRMEAEVYTGMCELFKAYLTEKKLRKTEERFTIFKMICTFPGHFDVSILLEHLEQINFHVSRATLYNTLDLLVNAGLVVRHQLPSLEAVQYELRIYADTHTHLICTQCGTIRELKNDDLKRTLRRTRISRFTPEYYCLYIYGICNTCKANRKKQ